jgi:L-fuconolactonase
VLIVDAQIHIWGAHTRERPWPSPETARPQRPVPLGADELLREMDAAGVDRAVLVPPSWEGDRNDLALAAARAHPERFAVMGRLQPESPEAPGLLANWLREPGMLGLRFTFHRSPFQEQLTSDRLDWLWEDAEKHGVPIMLLVPQALVPAVDRIAERHPGLRIAVDHCALVDGKDEEAFAEFDKLLAISKRPNVAVKASSFPCFTADAYPYRAIHKYLRQVYDAFGPQRMFWGTDLSRLPCSYRQAVTLFTEELPWLSARDQEWILGRGICAWLPWKRT